MSLAQAQLRKLLGLFFAEPNRRRAELRKDIRSEIARETGPVGGGGDFYGPFWADAKSHVFGKIDLSSITQDRIDANARRSNLYPQLLIGFLTWWNERRRWTNAPFYPGESYKADISFPDLQAVVKVENILSVRDANGAERVIYPYFYLEPRLTEESARLGLWLLSAALPHVPLANVRILDVIRGQTFSIDRNPLLGDEQSNFHFRFAALLSERATLRTEYQ